MTEYTERKEHAKVFESCLGPTGLEESFQIRRRVSGCNRLTTHFGDSWSKRDQCSVSVSVISYHRQPIAVPDISC